MPDILFILLILFIVLSSPIWGFWVADQRYKRKHRPKSDQLWRDLDNEDDNKSVEARTNTLMRIYGFNLRIAGDLVICWYNDDYEGFIKICKQDKRIKIIK